MDIIRNLITDGISPDVLIKRGATRKYVLAVCEDLAKFDRLGLGDAQPSDHGTTDNSMSHSVSGPSLLHCGSPNAIDMTRDGSSSSSSSVEVSDVIDDMLSPRPVHRPVPSSSWKPNAPSSSGSSDKPLVRTDTYKPGTSSTFPGFPTPTSAHTPVPVKLSHNAVPFVSALPRPVSSYVPSTSGVQSLPSREDHMARDINPGDPIASLGRPLPPPTSSTLPPTVSASDSTTSTTPTPSTTLTLETLAERKKRVLESMKRSRKLNAVTAGGSTGTSTPLTVPGDLTPPTAATSQDTASIKANFDSEVAALEREVMGLQSIQADTKIEVEEGEITPSATPPPPALPSDSLPTRATLNPSTASTNHTNGVRMNRASKRPHAEDLMESRATSAKPTRPARKRPFGRPLPYQHLLVRLDDSDDEKETQTTGRTPVPSEADRLRLEEDIKRLKARIEERRLAKAAKLKVEKTDSPSMTDVESLQEPVVESVEEDMDIDEDEPSDPVAPKDVAEVQGKPAAVVFWRPVLIPSSFVRDTFAGPVARRLNQ